MAELPISAGITSIQETSGATASKGVAISNPGSINTKTSYTTCIASTVRSCSALIVQLTVDAVATNLVTSGLFDIAVGASSSEVVIASNLLGQAMGYSAGFNNGTTTYVLPIQVPAGTRISARWQAQATTSRGYVTVALMSGGAGLLNGSGSVESWGLSTASSIGTVLDPGGTANTKGSYTQLVASTSRNCREVSIVLYSPDVDSAGNDQVNKFWAVDIAVGAAASEVIIVPDLMASRGWSTNFSPTGSLRLPISIPAGTRISARCASTSNNATGSVRKIGIAMYGIG